MRRLRDHRTADPATQIREPVRTSVHSVTSSARVRRKDWDSLSLQRPSWGRHLLELVIRTVRRHRSASISPLKISSFGRTLNVRRTGGHHEHSLDDHHRVRGRHDRKIASLWTERAFGVYPDDLARNCGCLRCHLPGPGHRVVSGWGRRWFHWRNRWRNHSPRGVGHARTSYRLSPMDRRSLVRNLVTETSLVLLSQKVAADGEQNHLFGRIHTSAMGRLVWVCRDQTMMKRGFRPMWRGSRA